NRDIRERCVFVRHDLATDPPFSKLDLVSCRNLLIYMGPVLQKRVIPILHYALHQPGYLVLGPAETIAGFESMFSTVDAEARIYTRKPVARAALTFPSAGRLDRLPWRRAADAGRSALDVQRDVDHVLLARYAPACVLVDDNLDVVQFRGRTGPYLEAPPGQPQLSLLRMAREGLASELPLAIERARRADAAVRQPNVVVRERGHEHVFNLEVIPLPGAIEARGYFLIVFEEVTAAMLPARRTGKKAARPREQGELLRARQELAATKEYLHSVVTQHLATSEELGITNEELQSSNEELQSSNEELQTAKEELQSTNEELETVNEELQRGNQLLREANDDLVNVLASVEIAIIIVDTERRVRRYTPTARDVMRLIPGDVGRPIGDLRTTVAVPGLDEAIAESIDTLAVHESEVHHTDGTVYRMQIRPYRTEDHTISGAVIAFVDITALRAARDRAAAIVETVPTPLVVVDDRLHVLSANGAFIAAFGIADPHDLAGRTLFDIGEWRAPDLRARLERVIASGVGVADLEADHHGAGGERNLKLAANPIPAADGRRTLLIGMADVTEHRRLEQAREAAKKERDAFLDSVSHELRTPLSAIVLWAQALRELAPDDPRRSQAIETILSSARAEAELVDDLLELSTSRPSTMKLDATVPSSVVREVVDHNRHAAEAKQIALTVQIEPALDVPMTTDARRLRQITSELVGNAIKFTPAGGKVSIDLGVENGTMRLRVHDTGPGIPPEFVARAFEPFAQVDASTTRTHRGLGIGLARVRRFVENQGGVVDIDSPGDGQGTTFTVSLPTRP
ncbi:MAG TPA: ATP-binding protein, partial [Kofleriaceae bacterium]|nr:ATP-binding protein [Kofleriaceae bacterium]